MKQIATLLFLLLLTSLTYGQHGVIKGTIVNKNGQPLQFANIAIRQLNTGAISDPRGGFSIPQLRPGTYDIVFSMIGFQTIKIKRTIVAEQVCTLNIQLEEDLSKLNEVIVTGVSRATAVRKNPIPIAVISKREMNMNVNNNLIDAIVKGIPGVSAVTTGPNISKPFIRGLGYNRVLTLYDGVRQEGQQWGDEHGIEIDQYGVSRAEVVKGPASLTYGSDALAGVINMIPDIPSLTPGKLQGSFLADYHSNNGMLGSSLGLAYGQNDWKYVFRATAKTAHNYRNKVDGWVYGTAFREYNLSALARTDKSWGSTQIGATLYDNTQEIPDGSRDSLTRKFTKQVKEEYDIKDRPLVPENELRSYSINPLHQHIQHYRVYNRTKWNLGDGDINAMIGLQQSIRREYNHPEMPAQPGLYVVLNTLNYDIRYNVPAMDGWETTVGVNGMYQSNASKNGTDFPIPDYRLFDIGGFVFAKKTIGKIDISGGLRYDNRTIRWNNFYVGPNKQNGFEQHVRGVDTVEARLQFPAFSHSYTGISGSLGATWNISERVLFKANIARGYRAPNITEIGSNGLDPGAHIVYLGNRGFKPEFSLQEDIGIQAWLPDADISIELFNNDIDNYIYQARLYDNNGNPVVIVPGNATYRYQQSAARLYGAELAVNLHPRQIAWLAVNNSLAYIQGRNKNQELIRLHGKEARYLPFIPPTHIRSEWRATAQQNYGLFTKAYIRAEVDIIADQPHFYGVDNTETFTAGYTLFNVGAGSGIISKKGKTVCEVFLQLDNIANVAYQANTNRLKYFEYYTASPNGRLGIYNMGRNFSAKVIVPF
ncbi:iron complex outermembrane receptor protein [Chitinophaga polysaccharea]|uniref:Iron complex outermembrane receptor protein n=1 Tax=Chitinophaga polysaccharea TaxID=1293035 RepID=A0A561Q3J0_9BACT|nr:TonB-dependent receptor [Chitinophaga polysaccharea]TWF44925.1 iron complex outermembrane receptor protein [Chitinophaga polysaccharea]